MNLSACQDLVRDLIGNRELEPHMLSFFMGSGRREVEKRGNFYWMVPAKPKEFSLTVDGGAYSIANDLSLTDFKEPRFFATKAPNTYDWSPAYIKGLEQLITAYATNSTGQPEEIAADNDTLYVFPVKPNKDYDAILGYFQWTSNPVLTAEDELTKRWPEALIFGATAAGIRLLTRDETQAQPYVAQLEREIIKVAEYSHDRLRLPDIDRKVIGIKQG